MSLISSPDSPVSPALIHTRITPDRGGVRLPFGDLWRYRDLLLVMAQRDVKVRYKQTGIGIAWVVIQPLTAALIFAFVFGRIAALQTSDIPYLPFVFAALLPWNVFSGAVGRAGGSLVASAQLLSKVYFPRLVIPISAALGVLVDFAVALVVMLILLVAYGIPFTWNLLAILPLTVLALLAAAAVGTIIAALSVYYRDFSYALPFLLQVWLYASPVVYATDVIGAGARPFFALNPMVGIIDGFRWALFGGAFPALELAIAVCMTVIALVIGLIVFARVETSFADVV
ncbi:MAG: ABC transporter permease [Chloroflexota bacterium]|nr:ABC transporter permease [Chloroflexota bacterium]